MFQINMDEYLYLLDNFVEISNNHGLNAFKANLSADVNCVEKMLFLLSQKTGKSEQFKNELKNFLKSCSGKIGFKEFTAIATFE